MTGLTLIIGNKNYSSWSLRAWLMLRATRQSFAEEVIFLDLPDTAEKIRRHSPAGKVPILIDDRLIIHESLAIAEYLAERFPAAGLWPSDPAARAIARSVAAEMHAGFADLRQSMPMNCRARRPGAGRTAETMADIERITALWADCRSRFGADGPFLFGQFTIADAMYAPVVSRLVTYEVECDAVAGAYCDAVMAWPAMQDWLAAAKTEPATIEREEVT